MKLTKWLNWLREGCCEPDLVTTADALEPASKFPPHMCESDVPVAVVPVPGVHEGRETTKTAILYRCDVCFDYWEEIFNGLYTAKDFEK